MNGLKRIQPFNNANNGIKVIQPFSTKLNTQAETNPKKNKTYPLRLKFELKKNQITVLNRKIVDKQKPYNARGGGHLI